MWHSNLPSPSLLGCCHKGLVRGQNFHSLLVESSYPLPPSFVMSMETTWRAPPSSNKVPLSLNYWVGCLKNPTRESRLTSVLSINEAGSLCCQGSHMGSHESHSWPAGIRMLFGCQEMPVWEPGLLTSPGSNEEANFFASLHGNRGRYLR